MSTSLTLKLPSIKQLLYIFKLELNVKYITNMSLVITKPPNTYNQRVYHGPASGRAQGSHHTSSSSAIPPLIAEKATIETSGLLNEHFIISNRSICCCLLLRNFNV